MNSSTKSFTLTITQNKEYKILRKLEFLLLTTPLFDASSTLDALHALEARRDVLHARDALHLRARMTQVLTDNIIALVKG